MDCTGLRTTANTKGGVAVKAAIYARVSTSNGSQTCENQLLELRRYCDARGWIVHAEYTDEMSGQRTAGRVSIDCCSTPVGRGSKSSSAGPWIESAGI